MKTQFKILVGLLFLLSLILTRGGLRASGESSMPVNKVPGSVESKARRLMNNLKKQGFQVERGYFKLYTNADCPTSFKEIGTCWGNNPAAPYVQFAIPPWPEEYIDPATDTAYGLNLDGYSTSYRLDPREAIVILGVMPPPAHYFGLQTYHFTRQGDFDTNSDPYQYMKDKPLLLNRFFNKVPQNQERVINFASLSNSINHVVIERQSGKAFDQQKYFIITPDQTMNETIRKTLSTISVVDKDIFTEQIPSNMFLGLDESADDFVTVIRYAMPDDGGGEGARSTAWREELPLVVLRVRDTRPDRLPVAYPPFTEPEEKQISDEFYLEDDLENLVGAISQRWGQPSAASKAMQFLRVETPPITMVGPKCSPIGMNCLGDTQDATYQYSFPLPVGSQIIYAVAGTLGTQTGNATYVGLGLNSTPRLLGFDNRADEDLVNSANNYAQTVNNTEKLFVYYFTRDCSDLEQFTDGYCLELSNDDLPLCPNPTDPACYKLTLSIRDYMPLGSQRGPDANYILPAWVIPLQKP
ncbi:MAG: hypothetical protein H6Q37_2683 [Chloroflexi bacterium]|nr:hypothetical protein [Chloroflexota bacterium]